MKKFFFSNLFTFFLISITTGIFYFYTASRQLTFANFGNDGGDFLAAILTGGIPHPTGYPTYTILGILFQKLPVGDPYFRGVMLSWIPASIGAGLLSIFVRHFLDEKIKKVQAITISLMTGLIWGFIPFLWSQAVIVEVHGLQSLFLVLMLWYSWVLLDKPHSNQNPYLLVFFAFCFGLAAGNHITILFFLPVIVYGIYKTIRRGNPLKWVLFQILAFMLGCLIYLYLPIRAATYPPINWGNPQTMEGFWWVISGSPYQNLVTDITFSQALSRISALAGLLMEQFGIPGILVGVLGAVQYKHKNKAFPVSLLVLFLVYAIFSILYGTDDSLAYLLASYLVFTVWIMTGLSLLISYQLKNYPVGVYLAIVYIIFILISIPNTIQKIDPRDQNQPAVYAEEFLEAVPENVIVLTSSDPDSFPLWYYHYGLGLRPDIKVVVLPLTQFKWYQETMLYTYPELEFPTVITQTTNKSQSWGEKIPGLNPQYPVCRSKLVLEPQKIIEITCSSGENFHYNIAEN